MQRAATMRRRCSARRGARKEKTTECLTYNLIFYHLSRCSAVGSAPVSGTGGREFESRHFDQKREPLLASGSLFWSKRCYDSNLSCVARCEFAYPTRRSESLLSRRRVWIYSLTVKIPPPAFFFREFSDGSQA